MKDKKLLVKIRETSRDFYLFKPSDSNDWHIKFTLPRVALANGGAVRRITRSLGTPLLVPARERAQHLLSSFFSSDEGRGAESKKLRQEPFAMLMEVVQAYRLKARTVSDKEDLKDATINGNIGCLRKLVGVGGLVWTADCLTSELIDDFKRRELGPVRDDPMALEGKKRSVNSTIRQARSIFSKEYLPLYAHLHLPDLTGFREAKGCKVDRQATRYVPIAQERIDAMEREIRSLRDNLTVRDVSVRAGLALSLDMTEGDRKVRAMYLAFYFMLWLGMRLGEVIESRLEWLEEWPTGARMAIVRRPYFKPKGVPGMIAVAPRLLADIKEMSGAKESSDYLIPAATMTERRDVLRYDLSRLVRRHLGDDRTKTCHELRKHAISMMLMRTRNYVDTLKFSRHADVRTLQEHYGSFLDELAPITSSDWRSDALAAT